MKKENGKAVIALSVILALLIGGLAGFLSGYNGSPDPLVETEIQVVEVEVPYIQADPKVGEVWDKLYSDEVEELEEDALEATLDELDKDYIEDRLEALGFDVDKVKSYEVDEDETEVTITNLGLDDEDDQEANVYLEVLVKYKLREGQDAVFKIVLPVDAVYSVDDGEGEAVLA